MLPMLINYIFLEKNRLREKKNEKLEDMEISGSVNSYYKNVLREWEFSML